jgi:hypothetical protein
MRTAEAIGMAPEAKQTKSEIASGSPRLCSMSSQDLLRFGMNLKYRRSLLGNRAGTQTFTEELGRVSTEWRKRFPEMPLHDTF